MFEKLKFSPFKENTIKNLYKAIESNKIDRNPDYQRLGNIWKKDKKQLLIDSIINKYDIPKIYFHYLSGSSLKINDSNKLVAIIDGKQRIETIYEFLNNEFGLSKNFTYLEDSSINLKGYTFSKIEKEYPKIAFDIENFIFDIVYIETDEKERIEDLFLRLNEGVPLNNAERRKSLGGYLVNYCLEEIESKSFFTDKLNFENKRLEHFDLYTKLILLEHYEDIKSFTKTNLDKLILENKIKNELIENSIKQLNKKIEIWENIFDSKDNLLKSKSIIPLYYLFFEDNKSESMENLIYFLRVFEKIRTENRKDTPKNKVNNMLIEFDRLNQQGANQKKSLKKRLIIINEYYKYYKKNSYINIDVKIKIDSSENNIYSEDSFV